MNRLTNDDIERLSGFSGKTALTIYMPTHSTPTSPNITENQTRYKNLIRNGFEKLSGQLGSEEFREVRQQLEQKIDDIDFWQNMSRSLGVFITSNRVEMFHLPIEVPEQIYVGDSYDIIPILQVKSMNQPYYLFALAMHESKLFKGDMYGLEAVEIELPKSPEDALRIDEMFINSNTIRQGSGSMKTNPHGQGDSQEAGQEERLMYFRILDSTLMKADSVDKECPVLIAATDSEAADFKNISKIPHILTQHVSGNRTKDNLHDLHELGYPIVIEEVVSSHMKEIAEQYDRSVGAEKATADIGDIEKAAEEGRVDSLLLSPFEESKDSVSDKQGDSVLIPSTDLQMKETLLSLVKKVLTTGGNIEIFSRYMMPAHAKVAALYRY